MALSTKARARLTVVMAQKALAKEIADAVDSGANAKAAHVANVVAADATDLPSALTLGSANKAAINAILAALQAVGLMA